MKFVGLDFIVGVVNRLGNDARVERQHRRGRYPSVNSLHPARRGDLALHPTVKPVALIADLIRDCSKRNGIILDPFGGSGTTILAAQRTGRIARLIELDPLYVDVTVRRWEKIIGIPARHATSGLSFERRRAWRHRRGLMAPPNEPPAHPFHRSLDMVLYKVGYCKPPKAKQFKPGRSGNPKGRPKGSRNLATDLAAELGEQITVREEGRSRRISKQRALIKSPDFRCHAFRGEACSRRCRYPMSTIV